MDKQRAAIEKPRWKKYWFFLLLFSLVIGIYLLTSFLGNASYFIERNSIVTATVEQGDFRVNVRATGVLKPLNIRWVSSQVSGRLEQVLINLIKNAAEAMENSEQKVIDIFSQEDLKWQHIIIGDSGCGIANPDNIFVPFYTTKSQGSGIGLALCRHILFNHNGLIKVTNHQYKQGVEVRISLPK